jgi:N-acetylglucosaminyl-diphospho-decaprenol L-rhamnosyltransferase
MTPPQDQTAPNAPTALADALARCTAHADGASVLVVTVSYKTAGLVLNGLAALAAEVAADPRLRVVVVDNTCGEDAREIAPVIAERGWGAWAMLLVSDKNGGYAYGNNLAIREALRAKSPPEYFWMLNPDAEARPGAARALVDYFDRDPRIGITGSALLDPDGSVWGYAFRFPTVWSELESGAELGVLSRLMKDHVVAIKMGDQPQQVDWLPGASMMVRRAVFDSGLFDEGYFLYHEETDFCLHAQQAGWSCWYVPASRVLHIAGSSTGVTSREGPPKRKPQYLFDSRRRYFTKNHGWAYAVLADLAWTAGFASRRVRRRLQGRGHEDPPHLLWDSLRNSALLKGGPWHPGSGNNHRP